VFPENGAEKLIAQITGFGTESHDDLSDAFCILVLSIIEQESRVIKGHIELFSEQMLANSYHEPIPFYGEKRLGVILADKHRAYSTIVIRAENAAQVLFHEMTDDAHTVAIKVIDFARKYDVPISDQNIFVDRDGRGHELCSYIASYAQGHFIINKYADRQRYGLDLTQGYQYNDGQYKDIYTAGYAKLAKWLRGVGKLIGRPVFDDLLHIVYSNDNGKMKMVDKDILLEQGIDSSIPDALAMTTAKDKRVIIRPHEDDFPSHRDLPDPYYDESSQFPDIGI
jgi:hypothetical protein